MRLEQGGRARTKGKSRGGWGSQGRRGRAGHFSDVEVREQNMVPEGSGLVTGQPGGLSLIGNLGQGA